MPNLLMFFLPGVATGAAAVGAWWWWIGHRAKVKALAQKTEQTVQQAAQQVKDALK